MRITSRPTRIALISDTHRTRGTAGEQPHYKERFARAIAAVNAAQVDLVLFGGDLTENGIDQEFEDFKAQAAVIERACLFVAGNHDVGDKILPGGQGGVTAERVARYDRLIGEQSVVHLPMRLRVIGVNASLLGSGLPIEELQWAFFERMLAKTFAAPTILLSHYPPFLESPDEPSDPYWNIEPEPRRRLLALLKRGGVRAVLSGHLHRPLVNRYDGIDFITAPSVAFGLPPGVQPEGWMLVTVSRDGEITAEVQEIAP